MKQLIIVTGLLLTFVAASIAQDSKKDEQNKKKAEVTFSVNMHCENCKARIEKTVTWEKGVKDLDVKLKEKTVRIVFDPRKTTTEKLQKVIENLGYTCEIPDSGKDKQTKDTVTLRNNGQEKRI
ncbi:MAG: heavy-metal-associated domain-containing protein [Tannerella sp.]|jgi:copper chaperone CopZ|nr:heavy-metal-associated domain-containing protein [Tannerella sp.]